jgi:hypothetical protein
VKLGEAAGFGIGGIRAVMVGLLGIYDLRVIPPVEIG